MEIELREIEPDDVDAVQDLIESDPDYVERVTGHPPAPADAQSLLLKRPDDLPESAKLVLGAWEGGSLVALVDLLRGWPTPDTAHVERFQVHGGHQGRGVGGAVHELMLARVRRWPEITTLRTAVLDTNAGPAAPFWRRQGYLPASEPEPYTYDKLRTTVRIWTRRVREETT